jgi:hypothetical protein
MLTDTLLFLTGTNHISARNKQIPILAPSLIRLCRSQTTLSGYAPNSFAPEGCAPASWDDAAVIGSLVVCLSILSICTTHALYNLAQLVWCII